MYIPSAFELLSCWEQGLHLPFHRRALVLLQTTYPAIAADDLAQLSIGERDAVLLRFREGLFGTHITSQATCPQCGEKLELKFTTQDILVDRPIDASRQFAMHIGEQEFVFRLPNSIDLDAIVLQSDASVRRQMLFDRCICNVQGDGIESRCDLMTSAIAASIESRMAQLDPQAQVELGMNCPACDQSWLAPFDIVSFLWMEISAWARRTMHEVHLLARAYGWSEPEILSLHPVKRQMYLQMVCG